MSWKDVPGVKPGAITGDAAWALLNFAKTNGFAIPAFNCTTSSSCNAVLEAAAKIDRPIMIQFSEGGSAFFAGKSLPNGKKEASILGAVAGAHYVRNVAVAYGVAVFVHSDHLPYTTASLQPVTSVWALVWARIGHFLPPLAPPLPQA